MYCNGMLIDNVDILSSLQILRFCKSYGTFVFSAPK